MAAITSQWWRGLVNAYEVKAGMVYLQGKSCDPYLSASRWGVIQIFVLLPLPFQPETTVGDGRTIPSDVVQHIARFRPY